MHSTSDLSAIGSGGMPQRDRYAHMSDLLTICVSGQYFMVRRSCLYRWPNSRLYMLAMNPEEHAECLYQSAREDSRRQFLSRSANTLFAGSFGNSHKNLLSAPVNAMTSSALELDLKEDNAIYYYDRDPEIFRFVLDYYRTGELHLPSNICGPFVRKELIYWGIDESFILPCCMPAYMRYDEERRIKKSLFKDCFEDIDSMQNLVNCCRGLKRWRYRLWLFLDHPSSSLVAKIWASVLLFFMIGSVVCYCLTTHTTFRKPRPFSLISNVSLVCHEDMVEQNPKLYKDCTTLPNPIILQIDIALNVLFTFEFLLKVALAPDRRRFLINFISLLDASILATFWLNQIIYYYCYVHDDGKEIREGVEVIPMWLHDILTTCQALRILRIFKISKVSRGLRVLMLTVKKSIPELVLLGFLLMNGMFMFSSLIYMAEYRVNDTFADIPEAFWWAIVTLTTVGYGDAYPKGGTGYLVGSITAVSGCVVTGLAIPIIGNNFNTYYKYMQNQLKEDKYLRVLRKNFSNTTITADQGDTIPPANRKYLQLRGELKPSLRGFSKGT
ncbi:hypothetical protein Ciccas_005073 [Cichlidogyrus casuarinus]|uniref:Uncharacterized protein n=1 Tax=Cichlidogyrus casuarinus TaxID=1844966 RepID=A0ABD2Q9S0_9PLAT